MGFVVYKTGHVGPSGKGAIGGNTVTKTELDKVSSKYLSPTERQAIEKLTKLHQPMLKELEKWKEQREKLETTLIEQIEMIGKILKPYYEQSQETLKSMTRLKQAAVKFPNKKTTSRKKSPAKKSKSR